MLALAWQDHLVIGLYLAGMVFIGWYAARRQGTDDEYFLASRSLPWYAVGMSIMATLMSSLTFLSEPGEVWKSGITNLLGKVIATLLETFIVLIVFIPFLMRFRFTSAYEYLDYRFNRIARWVGVGLFSCLTVSWMGFVVLAIARSLSHVSGISLPTVIATVGVVATAYTVMGGLRAVVWTDVSQTLLMLAGCLITIGYVMATTGTFVGDWFAVTNDHLAGQAAGLKFFSLDPYERTTIITAGVSMFVWNMVTHVGNQMMVQRYFSCNDLSNARRSFMVATVFHIVINGLLSVVGLAIVYYYVSGRGSLSVNPNTQADQVFPMFMVEVLPPGLTGAVLAAVMAAAMSTIDSGINSLATVVSVERRRLRGLEPSVAQSGDVRFAQVFTLAAGFVITLTAYLLDPVTRGGNILEMLPRTFNLFVVPMGGMFLLGMFAPWCSGRGAVAAAAGGLATSFLIAYSHLLFGTAKFSFTWVLPSTLLVMVAVSLLFRMFGLPPTARLRGLTWRRRHERPDIDPRLLAPEFSRNA